MMFTVIKSSSFLFSLFLFRGRIRIRNFLKGRKSIDLNSSQSKTLHCVMGYVLSNSSLPLPCDRNGRKRLTSPRVFALKKHEMSLLPMSLYFRFLIARQLGATYSLFSVCYFSVFCRAKFARVFSCTYILFLGRGLLYT
jgi:hypothetical protein